MISPKYHLNLNTVITPDNICEIIRELEEDLYSGCRTLSSEMTHSFEIMRPKRIDEPYAVFSKDLLRELYGLILRYKDKYFTGNLLMRALHYANISSLYRVQYDWVIYKKRWPFPCCARKDNQVIWSDGTKSDCELRAGKKVEIVNNYHPVAGTGTSVLYSLGGLSFGTGPYLERLMADEIYRQIKQESYFVRKLRERRNCSCSHLCWILPSMYRSNKMLFWVMPLRAVRYLFVRMGLARWF